MAKIAIVILNWNGLEFLQKFLPSVIEHSRDAAIYLADNNSYDTSVKFVTIEYPCIKIIQIDKNEGYSKGYNIALSQIEADFFVLLNSDVEVSENWINPIIHFMENDPSIAACQPKIKSFYNREKFEYAGAAGGFIDKFGYPFCRGRIFNDVETDYGQYDDVCEIFWATGACLVIRSEVYWNVGGLDNDFFAHMEEIDLCWRIKNAGYKIYYYGKSVIYHVGGGTLDKSRPTKTYLNFRNGLSLLYKNLPVNKLIETIFLRMVLDGIAAFKFLIFDSKGHFWAVFKAHIYFYKNLKKLKIKRRDSELLVKKYDQSLIFQKSIVIEHYIKKKGMFQQLKWDRNN